MLYLDMKDREVLTGRLTKIQNSILGLNYIHNGKNVQVTVSMGATKFSPGQGITLENLIAAADQELIRVKKTSRGSFSING